MTSVYLSPPNSQPSHALPNASYFLHLPLARLASENPSQKSFKDSLDIIQIELHILMSNGQWQRAVEMLLMFNIHILSDAGRHFACGRQRLVQSVGVVLDQTLQPIKRTGFKATVCVIKGDICC